MKIINKIKAFFIHQEEPVELDLIAAEIKEGKSDLILSSYMALLSLNTS